MNDELKNETGLTAAPLVGIIMGSSSDWETMENTANMLRDLGVPFETRVYGRPDTRLAV